MANNGYKKNNYGGQNRNNNAGRKGGYHGGGNYGGNHSGNHGGNGGEKHPADTASAAYNFIEFPDKAVPAPLDKYRGQITAGGKSLRAAFAQYIQSEGKNSGSLKLKLTARTPIFIGGNGDQPEEFFTIGNQVVIPGSSLRGMLKNVFKILTCGTVRGDEDIKERHLYYRCLMSTWKTPFNDNLHAAYQERMSQRVKGKVVKNTKPGFLIGSKGRYYIYPIIEGQTHSIGIWEYLQKYKPACFKNGRPVGKMDKSYVHWDGTKAYCVVALLSLRDLKDKAGRDRFMRDTPPRERRKFGKQYYRYLDTKEMDKSHRIEVPAEVVESYRDDHNRRGMDLLDESSDSGVIHGKKAAKLSGIEGAESLVPCFYVEKDGQVTSFGHGQSFRIAYEHSIMDCVPDKLQGDVVDFTTAVFGQSTDTASWASRVSFSDAVPVGTVAKESSDYAHALMQPNPTSYQLYLKQDDRSQLKHWDSAGSQLRGYKFYWHGKEDWKANNGERQVNRENGGKVLHKIRPVKAGQEFEGTIRFHDLSDIELGALLKVFHLSGEGKDHQEDIAFKLGQGKSIGLGSVSIKAKLYLDKPLTSDGLFNESGWNDAEQAADEKNYIKAFESYMQSQASATYDKTLKQLQMAMDLRISENKPVQGYTTMMMGTYNGKTLNLDSRFAGRNPLPDLRKLMSLANKK